MPNIKNDKPKVTRFDMTAFINSLNYGFFGVVVVGGVVFFFFVVGCFALFQSKSTSILFVGFLADFDFALELALFAVLLDR